MDTGSKDKWIEWMKKVQREVKGDMAEEGKLVMRLERGEKDCSEGEKERTYS